MINYTVDNDNDEADLSIPAVRRDIAAQIKADIDEYCAKHYNDGHRTHLGASLIGHECDRYLWGVFRWLKLDQPGGRMQRLWNRGHREEPKFIEHYRGIGCEVWELAENDKQFRISNIESHFGGSLDGKIKLAPKYRVKQTLLSEFKTQATGSNFTKLQEKGVKFCKPLHFDQMSCYGKEYGFKYALYTCVNKNDDDLHVEIVELDWSRYDVLMLKAFDIISSQVAPQKIADSPAYMACKYCHLQGICHEGHSPEKNCRSCKYASPIENADWFCNGYKNVIPSDFIPKGCDRWEAIV